MACRRELRARELIPIVSFILERGRCRSCGSAFSAQYPLIEVSSGLLFAFLPWAVFGAHRLSVFASGVSPPFWYYAFIGIFFLAGAIYLLASAIDARLAIIPDGLNLLIAALGVLKITLASVSESWGDFSGSFLGHYALLFGFRENIWVNHFVAAFFGALFFGLIFFLSRGRAMGFGDVKLAGATGLLLGWPDTALSLGFAFIVGAIWGILLIMRGKKGMKSSVPFGPFIAIGVFLVVFFGERIMDGYFQLFP